MMRPLKKKEDLIDKEKNLQSESKNEKPSFQDRVQILLIDDDLELLAVLDRLAEGLGVDVIPGGLGACLHDQLDVQVVAVVADPTRELVLVVAHEDVLVDPQSVDSAEAKLYLSDPHLDLIA